MSIYLIDKRKDITSNQELNFFKKEFEIKKAGFSGVLDPFATGLLIVATNGDTKLLSLFTRLPKTYIGTILFGKRTDTLDIDGKIIKQIFDFKISLKEIENLISSEFIGKIYQRPPKFSNIKINGRRAHELSREKIEFDLNDVKREIFSFKIFNFTNNTIDFEVCVSSGTYIRSLVRDIGDKINIPTMLLSLRRVLIGDIKIPEKNFSKIELKNILPIPYKKIESMKLIKFLHGKIVELPFYFEELIVFNENKVIWVKKISDNKFKIFKNIR